MNRKDILGKSNYKFLLRCRELDIFSQTIDNFDINSKQIDLRSNTGNKQFSEDIKKLKISTLNTLIKDSRIHICCCGDDSPFFDFT